MNGVWKNFCLKIIHDFSGFEKVDEESKKIFSDSMTLSDKLALELQRTTSLNSLRYNTRGLLKTSWNWRLRARMKRDQRKK